VQNRTGTITGLKLFLLPKNNHWLKRNILVSAFVLFDYFSTLAFCRAPYEEANIYARTFMESFGMPLGLTLFVLAANLPIYIALCFDSHIVRLPFRAAVVIESLVDFVFAWFVAGLHFSGGTSWFWYVPGLTQQAFGAFLYVVIAFLLVKPYRPYYGR
jgi:hypothetical protein